MLGNKAACLSSPQFGTGAAGLCWRSQKRDAGHSSATGKALVNLNSLGIASARHNRSLKE